MVDIDAGSWWRSFSWCFWILGFSLFWLITTTNLLWWISLISDELRLRGAWTLGLSETILFHRNDVFESNCFHYFLSYSEVRRDLGREEISGLKCSLGNLELSSATTSWFVFLFQTKLLQWNVLASVMSDACLKLKVEIFDLLKYVLLTLTSRRKNVSILPNHIWLSQLLLIARPGRAKRAGSFSFQLS